MQGKRFRPIDRVGAKLAQKLIEAGQADLQSAQRSGGFLATITSGGPALEIQIFRVAPDSAGSIDFPPAGQAQPAAASQEESHVAGQVQGAKVSCGPGPAPAANWEQGRLAASRSLPPPAPGKKVVLRPCPARRRRPKGESSCGSGGAHRLHRP
jgi:hypothetical protein